nr:HNH endonuclease family protein [Cellulomonas sp. PhB143]
MLALAVLGVLVWITATHLAGPAGPVYGVSRPMLAAARADLAALPVRGSAPGDGYDRDEFGPAWDDVDGNGCDTRNDVLARDLTATTVDAEDACTVLSGTLVDPYGGATIAFERGPHSALVQIDHVVALNDAWRTGAQDLSADARRRLANDPANLLAVDGPLNQDKGAEDSATWLPPNRGFRCAYVLRQVEVKAAYGLWVTPEEHDAMAHELDGCRVVG